MLRKIRREINSSLRISRICWSRSFRRSVRRLWYSGRCFLYWSNSVCLTYWM